TTHFVAWSSRKTSATITSATARLRFRRAGAAAAGAAALPPAMSPSAIHHPVAAIAQVAGLLHLGQVPPAPAAFVPAGGRHRDAILPGTGRDGNLRDDADF